ncbi:MAG: NUDIX hydrolase [Chloroflexota bacterium]|nr:NUDIX hydrolase [Chloroflexota bacterium]
MEERTLSSRQVFAGRLITVRVDEVELANGHRSSREIVEHPGAVAIVALADDGGLVLVRQYRKAAETLTLELPAGTLSGGEDPLACAVRELKEETGYTARTMDELCSFYTAVGFCTEMMHLFLARGLEPGEAANEDDESIEVVLMPVEEALEMIDRHTIVDAKTVAGVLWARLFRAGQRVPGQLSLDATA